MVSINEACKIAGCSDTYLKRLLREGKLKGEKVSARCWLVNKKALIKLRDNLSSRAGSQK